MARWRGANSARQPAAETIGGVRIPVLLWTASLLVFLSSPVFYLSDSRYSMLTADSLVTNLTPDLSSFRVPEFAADLPFNTIDGLHAYQLERTNGRLLYGFPHGTSFLSAPFVAAMALVGVSAVKPDRTFDLGGELLLQKILAALLMASFVALSYQAARTLLGAGASALVAVAAGFGTQVWSTASRSMWAHTWEITLGIVVVLLLLRNLDGRRPLRPGWLATLLAWMCFVRPTGVLAAVAVSAYVVIYRRTEFLLFAAIGAVWLALFTAYTMRVFGTVFPFYYESQIWAKPGALPVALYGVLLSPSRGLFIFCPVVAVVLYLAARHWRALPQRALAWVAVFVFLGVIVITAAHADWWGGRCYGPRYLTDALPWLVLLAILALAALPDDARRLRHPAMLAGSVALLASVVLNGKGAMSWAANDWNDSGPLPAVMFDWSRPQFLAGSSHLHWPSSPKTWGVVAEPSAHR